MAVKDQKKKAQYGKIAAILASWMLIIAAMTWPEAVANAVQKALEQWYHGVAPALFPFMLLMPLIICPEAISMYGKILGRLTNKLFRLPGGVAPAIVIGMVAGSPAGVIAVGSAAQKAGLEKRQLLRIASCTCGLSPVFLISGIGSGILNRPDIGKMLFITQLITQIITLTATRYMRGDEKINLENIKSEDNGVSTAVISVLTIAGYMVLFNVLATVINQIIEGKAADFIICALEISIGAGKIAEINSSETVKMMILAGLCGFGGICIYAQNMKILAKYGITNMEYLIFKLINALLSTGIMGVQICFKGDYSWHMPEFSLSFVSLIAIILIIPALKGLKKSFS